MTEQATFNFDSPPLRKKVRRDEQAENLSRVRNRIGEHVLAFCRSCLANGGGEFHSEELRRYVEQKAPGAPASADRLLRQLRQEGVLDYVVLSRKQSLYRVLRAS